MAGEVLSQELRLIEPMVRSHLTHGKMNVLANQSGALQRDEMVLEPTTRRCGRLGSI